MDHHSGSPTVIQRLHLAARLVIITRLLRPFCAGFADLDFIGTAPAGAGMGRMDRIG
jgi:hypothetical protein